MQRKLFILVITYSMASCNFIQLAKLKKDEKLLANRHLQKFSMINNHIVFPVVFNRGQTRNMLLDLGASSVIMFSNGNFSYFDSLTPELVFGKSVSADNIVIKNKYYKLGDMHTVAFDLKNSFVPIIPVYVNKCAKYIGVWGADIFQDRILLLNFRDSTIAVFDTLPSISNWTHVESEFWYPHFYLILRIGNQKIKLLFDTGNSGSVVVPYKTFSNLFELSDTQFSSTEKWYGHVYISASGITSFDTTTIVKIKSAFLGDLEIDSVSLKISNNINQSGVGMEFIKKFNFLLDYKNNNIYLQRNLNYKHIATPTILNKKGFALINTQNKGIIVSAIKTGSQAEMAKLKIGDQIISINNIKVNENNKCDVINLINMRNTNNTILEIVVRRDGETLKLIL
jgi:hypothetical protein